MAISTTKGYHGRMAFQALKTPCRCMTQHNCCLNNVTFKCFHECFSTEQYWTNRQQQPPHVLAENRVTTRFLPVIGALIDYMDTSLQYLRRKTFYQAERLHAKASRATLSASFLASVCLVLGFVANVKLEVVTLTDEPLRSDLHFMLMSKDDKLYIDDIDLSKIMWCIEASDTLVLLISCILIWNSGNVRSPLSEYLFLPWMGVTLRGLFLRQAPTVGALMYTMAVIEGHVNPLFLTASTFLFLLEARLWLEITRLVRARWETRELIEAARGSHYELETLWSNDDVQSVEVRNYVY